MVQDPKDNRSFKEEQRNKDEQSPKDQRGAAQNNEVTNDDAGGIHEFEFEDTCIANPLGRQRVTCTDLPALIVFVIIFFIFGIISVLGIVMPSHYEKDYSLLPLWSVLSFAAFSVTYFIFVSIYAIPVVINWILTLIAIASLMTGTLYVWVISYGHIFDILRSGRRAWSGTCALICTAFAFVSLLRAVFLKVKFYKIRGGHEVVMKVYGRAITMFISSPYILALPALTSALLSLNFLTWAAGRYSSEQILTVRYSWVISETPFYISIEAVFKIFCLLWFSQFFLDCQYVVISGVIINHFVSHDRQQSAFPVMRSIWTLLCHHLGSVAFGSLFITLWLIPKNLIKFLRICLPRLQEPFYLNRNGYVMVIMERYSFFNASNKTEAMLVKRMNQVFLPLYLYLHIYLSVHLIIEHHSLKTVATHKSCIHMYITSKQNQLESHCCSDFEAP